MLGQMIDASRGAVSTMIGMTFGQRIGISRDIISETMWRTFGYITNTGRDIVIIGGVATRNNVIIFMGCFVLSPCYVTS